MAMSPSVEPNRPHSASRAVAPELGRHRIVIIGGGTAGITVAARLRRSGQDDIAIIEPSDKHYYQPLWTLVGAGAAPADETVRSEAQLIPEGVRWIQDHATEIDPVAQTVGVKGGGRVGYDFLVVAPGIQLDWDKVPGMREALETDSVSTNYLFQYAPKTFRLIESFQGGVALFTQPPGAIKCAGAPQKIAYLASDYFRKAGLLERGKVVFASGAKSIFAVAEFRKVLEGVVARYGIDARFNYELVEMRPESKLAIFDVKRETGTERVTIKYNIAHVVPPQSAPDFIKKSPLANKEGWAKADKFTLQNPDYPNVFALGDASELPTSRTGAAIRKQAPVLVDNLLAVMRGGEPAARYDGYASCPLVTSYDSMLLAEFDYDGKPTPSIPFIDLQKERYDMYLLKRYGLPAMYWNLMLRGFA
ncbi:NAD(P)/FAD-dependent oxidoreductase [Polyangium aurulentum]|nr:FAD/NAD(P)-binding oxidoreductase [Polyangium aurulentum]UQA58208.1 NAD(P)/FAD-dependent oxidoreductase [Polyangium aurulentum]